MRADFCPTFSRRSLSYLAMILARYITCKTLMVQRSWIWDSLNRSKEPISLIPALRTRIATSIVLSLEPIWSWYSCKVNILEKSALMHKVLMSFPACLAYSAISLSFWLILFSFLEIMQILNPCWAKFLQNPKPIPSDPPVTTAQASPLALYSAAYRLVGAKTGLTNCLHMKDENLLNMEYIHIDPRAMDADYQQLI